MRHLTTHVVLIVRLLVVLSIMSIGLSENTYLNCLRKVGLKRRSPRFRTSPLSLAYTLLPMWSFFVLNLRTVQVEITSYSMGNSFD
ncbi:uncharacterized protein F5891DRAFT_76341 [Suillus fuscotomentosus]|uniref:Uncharacterized protein n=1 Tax=Suillus fuscotomentosus TaxID=1912939 RepID=A0AAD4ECC1_9AGAM|nr:uncharacterized protein F5891DRAFT_76341 [Suillus fuscotomentosus]KAG1903561.1 hypothetical protein F5891DRAFT_76341 [Suillus fuscotomentosus]